MQPWVRILSIAAVAIVGAVAFLAGTPAALAYEDTAPIGEGTIVRAWLPRYGAIELARKFSNEGGPVELPHPIEKPEMHTTWIGATPAAPDSGKVTTLGAIPTGRGASAGFDAAAQAERRIQQVIRRLG